MVEQNEQGGAGRSRTWSFRGCELDPSDLTAAMVHLYRGEIQRANTWRTRLDATTNWAVITVAGALTFVFAAPTNPHFVFLLVFILVLTFLMIEARRYRYYVLWAYRVRLMETDFLAPIFTPPVSAFRRLGQPGIADAPRAVISHRPMGGHREALPPQLLLVVDSAGVQLGHQAHRPS
ncbi:MAG: DUF2270 domain-containing protein [Chloroflexota bacterium]|nr:DUF2270 domain-containing protein [Chloroflexota bacterium]